MTLASLMNLGAQVAQITYAKTSNRDRALRLLDDWATHDRHPNNTSFIQALARSRGHGDRALWAARWARAGFPQVVVGHKLAASLMATRIPPEAIDADEPPPWPAYAVILPDRLVPVLDRTANREGFASYVFVERAPGWMLLIVEVAETTFFIVRTSDSLADALNEDVEIDELGEVGDFRAEARDARLLEQIARLVIGVELELRDRSHVRAPRRSRTRAESRRGAAEPVAQTYVLTRDVVVDCRAEVVRHLRGERTTAPAVQVLVRGHWRQQAHGPAWGQRKWMHISPFWRGPEGAPIAVRHHAVRDVPQETAPDSG
jgi:hypothetical protein